MNCRSFLDFGTAVHSFTFTALKSDLENVSKSTSSLNNGSISTLEKSIFSAGFSSVFACTELFASFLAPPCVFIVGKSSTSLIAALFVKSIHILSIPNPIPPVGGIPISSAFRKSSSVVFASSSPCAKSSSWALKRSLWSIGSFSSEYAFAISQPFIKNSKRSVYSGFSGFFFVSGEISIGWSITNVGWIKCSSANSSKNNDKISPFLWCSSYSTWCSSASLRASSKVLTSFQSTPAYFSTASTIVIRSNGFPRSISTPL